MEPLDQLHLPQPITISWTDDPSRPAVPAIASTLIASRRSMLIHGAELDKVGLGDRLLIQAALGVGLGQYSGIARSIASRTEVEVGLTDAGRVLQRRQYWRLAMTPQAVPATLIDEYDNPIEAITIYLQNISGGGMKFVCDEPLDAGMRLRLRLPLGDDRVTATLTVLGSADDSQAGDEGYWLRGVFSQITERDRDTIIRYAFAQQQRLRDQRKQARVRLDLPAMLATLISYTGAFSKNFAVRVVDLNGAGMLFEADRSLTPNDKIRVFFKVSETAPVMPVVTILGVTDHRPGTDIPRYRGYFSEITTAETQHIQKLMAPPVLAVA